MTAAHFNTCAATTLIAVIGHLRRTLTGSSSVEAMPESWAAAHHASKPFVILIAVRGSAKKSGLNGRVRPTLHNRKFFKVWPQRKLTILTRMLEVEGGSLQITRCSSARGQQR